MVDRSSCSSIRWRWGSDYRSTEWHPYQAFPRRWTNSHSTPACPSFFVITTTSSLQSLVYTPHICSLASSHIQGGAKKRGHRPSYLIANIPKTPWPNCMEIGGLLQYYMLNTVINFLFNNFIALWRHLAKTPLLTFIHTVQIDLSISQ